MNRVGRRSISRLNLIGLPAAIAVLLAGCVSNLGERLCEWNPRPQHPKERPYVVREATVPGGAPGVRLAGELTMPYGDGPFSGIVLVSGSHVVDRDSKILGHKMFLVLADYLTRRGFAVYRHDDRGFGKSTGDTYSATDEDFAADSAAAMTWLKAQAGIDRTRTGYIGHSQGGLKAPLAATIEPVDFMILLAGGVQPNSTILLQQARDLGKLAGFSEEVLDKEVAHHRRVLQAVRDAETPKAAHAAVVEVAHTVGLSSSKARRVADTYATPWSFAAMRWDGDLFGELDYKLAGLLSGFDVPILALYPETDVLVRSEPNASLTHPLLTHPRSKVVELPGLNHMFQPAESGALEEGCEIETTFDPEALKLIGDWLANYLTEQQAGRYDFQARRYKRGAARLRTEKRE